MKKFYIRINGELWKWIIKCIENIIMEKEKRNISCLI